MTGVGREHPKHRVLELLEEAIRRDIHFIVRHPTTLFQCMWNTCWWYDCPEAQKHYIQSDVHWNHPGEKLHLFLEKWRIQKERARPGFCWLRSFRPPIVRLGSAQRMILRGHENKVTSVSYSSDGQCIVSGSEDKTVRVWDAASGTPLTVLRGHEDRVTSVCYSSDGQRIVSGSEDKTVRILDAHALADPGFRSTDFIRH